MASSRPTSSATNASFYHATSSSSSSNQNTNIPVGSLSLMVARFDTNNKNPSPALTLIPQQRLPIATRSNVVSSSNLPGGNAIRATSVIGQPLSAAPVTVSSSTPSISVRTTQLIGGQHQTTVPVVNLSTINNSNSHVQKQISTQRSITANALPIESVSLVMTNASESNVINRSMTRFTPNDSKSSATAHGINKTTAQRSNIIGPTIVSTQHKVGLTTTSNVPQIARFGIFSHVNPGSGSNKQGNIINLTAASLPKGHLILNSANITAASNTVHNMVTVSGASIGQTAKLTTSNVTATSTLNRQVVVTTTTPFGQIGTSQSQHRSIPLITTNTNSLQQPSTQQSVLQSPATTTTLTASPLRPAILSPANSPIKQTQHNLTPSSPRPSILSRKRTDQGNLTPTHSFKPSSTIATTTLTTTSTTVSSPLKSRTTINSTNESSSNEESRIFGANEVPPQNSGTALAMPTSDSMQTPRKKPRKQLLEPFNLKSSQNIQLLNSEIKVKEEYCNDKDAQLNNNTNTSNNNNKRRRASLLSAYNMQWKALQYHFLRYSDVKPKPEKKLTLSELSNEGLQRKNGWKIHHLATQMEVMSDNEMCVNKRLMHFLQTFQNDASNSPLLSSLSSASTTPSTSTSLSLSSSSSIPNSSHSSSSDNNKAQNNVSNSNNNSSCLMMTTATNSDSPFDVNCIAAKLTDLIRGNLQRSNLFSDQINEARQLVIKLTNDHKERVGKLTKKCANKRTYITK